MPYRPINDRHAVREVVFALTFSRPFNLGEVEKLDTAHDIWKAELPKKSRAQYLQIAFGPTTEAASSPSVGGVRFERIKADGSLDWRLGLEENFIAVNCLSYTRWADIWARARSLLQQAANVAVSEDNRTIGVGLQYIDVFVWEGDEGKCSPEQLLRRDSQFIPPNLWGKGPVWHLYQGWFRYDHLPAPGRLLEKVHLDAVEENKQFLVKIDSTLRLDLETHVAAGPELFGGEPPLIDRILDDLHQVNKRLVGGFLSDDMIHRINLYG